MQFTRIIGNIDQKLVEQAEIKISSIFIELATRYNNEHIGTLLGGDPFVFSLIYPIQHICTLNIPTAATDGKRLYWNPKFVLKQSKIGLRIICTHEAWHAIYMHPQRRGSRLPKLWNIAVDYIVNNTIMDDFKLRRKDPVEMFTKHLGKYMTLNQYAEFLKAPFEKIKGFEDLDPSEGSVQSNIELPSANEDRALTDSEMKELERREKVIKFYYADPDLEEDMKRPEAIYDFLYNLLPKCPKCGSIGVYKLPKNKKDKNNGKNKDKEKQQGKGDKSDQKDQGDKGDQHNHDGDQPCDQNCPGDQQGNGGNECDHGCSECGDGVDIFGLGGTVDDHMDTAESEEKLAKRVMEAMEAAKKMAGYVPAGLEDELGKLTAPKIKWMDVIKAKLIRTRNSNSRNDWTRFRSRPMFSGLLVPKKIGYTANFGCLLDTSGSMSKDDMAFGISQLAALDEKSEGVIVYADSNIYWDKAVKIKKCNQEELSKLKPVGRGGTVFSGFMSDYEKNIGKCDFLIVITDGYLMDTDIAEMKDPAIPVYWVITSGASFRAPFGKVMELRS